MAASIRVTGLNELNAALKAAGSNAPKYARKALEEEAQEAFVLSQSVVPVRYGILKGSGMVHPSEVRGTTVSVQITYGGPSAPYAIFVHEMPPSRVHHDYPTRWKYLENPVRVVARDMGKRMAVRVIEMINKGF